MHQSQITTVGNSNRFAALEVHILPSWFTASLGALVHGKGLLSVEEWEGFPNEKCCVGAPSDINAWIPRTNANHTNTPQGKLPHN
jgi:hypothetical protein